MKDNKDKIRVLQKAKNLLYDAYIAQNHAKCILQDFFTIDDDFKYLENDFYNIYRIDTATNLYKAELLLIVEINILKEKENGK